jgi:Flp pilus assembly protein TadD
LSQQPSNTKILIAKGDALMKAHRPAEAWKAYIRASELAPNDTALTGKLQALRSQRQSPARTEPTPHKERPTQVAAVNADAEAMVEPQNFSNVAEATHSN